MLISKDRKKKDGSFTCDNHGTIGKKYLMYYINSEGEKIYYCHKCFDDAFYKFIGAKK